MVLQEVADCSMDAKTIERVTHQVGEELTDQRERNWPDEKRPTQPPQLAVIQVDGGRIRVRQPGSGPGVHDTTWRESKNAYLVRMASACYSSDPHCSLPRAFQDASHVAEIAGISAPDGIDTVAHPIDGEVEDYRPTRLVRTCLSSLACSEAFGWQIQHEALRRGFDRAERKAYLGDGLPYTEKRTLPPFWQDRQSVGKNEVSRVWVFERTICYVGPVMRAAESDDGKRLTAEWDAVVDRRRFFEPGYCYHVLNRGVQRQRLFFTDHDYRDFEQLMEEIQQQVPLPIFAYELMPNHWHFVVRPRTREELSTYFQNVASTHAKRFRVASHTRGQGHVYQDRFKSFPVQSDAHFLALCRYVERNAAAGPTGIVRGGLAVEWPVAATPRSPWPATVRLAR